MPTIVNADGAENLNAKTILMVNLPRKYPFMSTNRLIKTMFGHAIFIAGIAYLFLLNIYECGGVLHNNI